MKRRIVQKSIDQKKIIILSSKGKEILIPFYSEYVDAIELKRITDNFSDARVIGIFTCSIPISFEVGEFKFCKKVLNYIRTGIKSDCINKIFCPNYYV